MENSFKEAVYLCFASILLRKASLNVNFTAHKIFLAQKLLRVWEVFDPGEVIG